MKKLLLFALASTLIAFGNNTQAQPGILHGKTSSNENRSGGTTYHCPEDPRICTTNTVNSGGSSTIVVYLYAENGNLIGTKTYHIAAGQGYMPDPRNGYIHSVITPEGERWMQFVSENPL